MIRQFVASAFCLKCQGCCRFSRLDSVWAPTLLNAEIERLVKKGLPPALLSTGNKFRLISHPRQEVYICPLLNTDDNKCKVYAQRPLECSLYPFLINRRQTQTFLALDLKCPFLQGRIHTPELQEHAQYLAGLLESPEYVTQLKDNPQVMQTYQEVLELRELKI